MARRKWQDGEQVKGFTVIKYLGKNSKYLALCSCGAETVIIPKRIHERIGCRNCAKGRSKPHKQLPNNEALFNIVVTQYKRSAKKRKIAYQLTDKQVIDLVIQDCHWCGNPPSRKTYLPKYPNRFILTNGIDRVNNTLGYTINNCVPCCKQCNIAKRTLTREEFLSWINRVHNKWFEATI